MALINSIVGSQPNHVKSSTHLDMQEHNNFSFCEWIKPQKRWCKCLGQRVPCQCGSWRGRRRHQHLRIHVILSAKLPKIQAPGCWEQAVQKPSHQKEEWERVALNYSVFVKLEWPPNHCVNTGRCNVYDCLYAMVLFLSALEKGFQLSPVRIQVEKMKNMEAVPRLHPNSFL